MNTYRTGVDLQRFGIREFESYVILQRADGREVERLTRPKALAPILEGMERVVRATAGDRRDVRLYVPTMGPVTPERAREVAEWAERLDDPSLDVRDDASSRLVRLGHPALVLLSARPPADDPEVRFRVREIIDRLDPVRRFIERHGLKP
jgi:hypothetical protein